MDPFDEGNVEKLLGKLGLNKDNYFIAMTKPSNITKAFIGNIAEFFDRYCIVNYTDTELNLIMTSRINTRVATEIIKIPRTEIIDIKLSNILISYTMNIKVKDSTLKFQVFKKVAKFSKLKESIENFKKIYNLDN